METNNKTFLNLLLQLKSGAGEKQLFFEKQGNNWNGITMIEHMRLVSQIKNLFYQYGIYPGRKLLLVAQNSYFWQALEHAAIIHGLEIVTLEAHISETALINTLGAEQFHMVVTDDTEKLQWLKDNASNVWTTIDQLKAAVEDSSEMSLDMPRISEARMRIYTSGTTGEPKRITYKETQLVETIEAVTEFFELDGTNHRTLCWLPMANLFQRMFNMVAVKKLVPIYYIANPMEVTKALPEVRPTVLIVIPRFVEKIYKHATMSMAKIPGFLRPLVTPIFNRSVKNLLGGRLKYMISGSAKCHMNVLEFFEKLDCRILEAYGMSESILPVAMNTPTHYRLGTVGRALPENLVEINSEGEILLSSPGSFINEQIQTGDKGSIDKDGYISIDGRLNELVKSSTGRKISLLQLDALFVSTPHANTVVSVGEGFPYPTLILDPSKDLEEKEIVQIKKHVQKLNKKLSKHQRIGAVVLSNAKISVDSGLMTANLKLRRNKIIQTNDDQLKIAYSKHLTDDNSKVIRINEN